MLKLYNNLDDHELMRMLIRDNGNEALFREIIRRYQKKVYYQVRRIISNHDDADDVCQQVFINLWKKATSFRFDSTLGSYLYRIAYNESISLLRKKKSGISLDDPELTGMGMPETIHDTLMLSGEKIIKKLEQALETLPEKQRLVFHYRFYDDLSFSEISNITGTSEGALKASYHFAAGKIKNILTND